VLDYDVSANRRSVEYPTFPCRGFWALEKADDRRAEFVEHITDGADQCQDGSRVVVTKIDDHYVSIAYFLSGLHEGVIAFSVLERHKGDPRRPPAPVSSGTS
jgi:hypothetical protein